MLVDAEKVREKLAKMCDDLNSQPIRPSGCAVAIRQADLSDCAVVSDEAVVVAAKATLVIESQAAEIERLKEDAERYRWLRQSDCRDGVPFIAIFDGRLSQWTGMAADEQVDSATDKARTP